MLNTLTRCYGYAVADKPRPTVQTVEAWFMNLCCLSTTKIIPFWARDTSRICYQNPENPPTLLATIQVIRYIRILDILWYCDHGWTHKSNWIKTYGNHKSKWMKVHGWKRFKTYARPLPRVYAIFLFLPLSNQPRLNTQQQGRGGAKQKNSIYSWQRTDIFLN